MAGISFNYDSAKSTAKSISNKGGQVETLINDIQKEIGNASGWWTGEDYKAFDAYFTQMKPKLIEFAATLKKTGESLNKVADIKKDQEQQLAKAFK